MKKSNLIIKSLVIVAAIGLFYVAGCKKDKNSSTPTTTTTTTTTPTTTLQSVNNSNVAEASSNDVLAVSEDVIYYNTVNSDKRGNKRYNIKYSWNCATVTCTDSVPLYGVTYHELIIDFGTDSVSCGPSGQYRQGQIIVYYHGRLFTKGFKDSILFNNFYLHARNISGYHSVTNIGPVNGFITWNVNANITVKNPNGKFHSWSAHRQRTLTTDTVVSGSAIDALIYKISDQAGYVTNVTGVTSQDSTYTGTIAIASPLIKHVNCFWIESGIIVINVTGKPQAVLNFGTDGTCNDNATLTYKGKTYNIKI